MCICWKCRQSNHTIYIYGHSMLVSRAIQSQWGNILICSIFNHFNWSGQSVHCIFFFALTELNIQNIFFSWLPKCQNAHCHRNYFCFNISFIIKDTKTNIFNSNIYAQAHWTKQKTKILFAKTINLLHI